MPVYVTRAHVTIGDQKNKKPTSRRPIVPKHVFQISDICRTPYCLRTLIVSTLGFMVVAGGVIMTIIGYRPGILLPWYKPYNNTGNNSTDPAAVPRILGEPGPLRVLVYIGPTLMGIGFFAMMMAIVLFCEIKDRYFNNILPKNADRKDVKDNLYDKIIDEFRKNYFRGIEVPLPKRQERRKSKGRLSISLSRSGSILSFGRRLSADFQRRRRKSSKESQSERIPTTKPKRSTIKRFLDRDSWMKTSSLPNIRHKGSFVELQSIEEIQSKKRQNDVKSKSCGPVLGILNIPPEINGFDNPAYKDSPPDKRDLVPLTKHKSLDMTPANTHITTVLVHRESNNEDKTSNKRKLRRQSAYEIPSNRDHDRSSNDSVIDIDKDISIGIDEAKENIPKRSNCDSVPNTLRLIETKCFCGTDTFCTLHSLGIDSEASSMSLSWDNAPCEWNDARRNTEPFVIYQKSINQNKDNNLLNVNDVFGFRRFSNACNTSNSNAHNIQPIQCQETREPEVKRVKKGVTGMNVRFEDTSVRIRKPKGPFKSRIGVFKSDSNLFRVNTYSLLCDSNVDSLSLDSLELTEDQLKNFEVNIKRN